MDRPPNSMVIEFCDKNDLDYACYSATLDITLYITHLAGIAKRCEKNFPEVAEGLRGTADGLKQHLQGVDGEWRTPSTEGMREILSTDSFKDFRWSYEFCRDPRAAQLLVGCCVAIAGAKPEMTFWEVLTLARGKLSTMEPLIERLLASSPLRKPQ